MSGVTTCSRCLSLPCRCVYTPIHARPLVIALSDADVERIARRVVELMREEKR